MPQILREHSQTLDPLMSSKLTRAERMSMSDCQLRSATADDHDKPQADESQITSALCELRFSNAVMPCSLVLGGRRRSKNI